MATFRQLGENVERQGLEAWIQEEPLDPNRRRIYGDWLEEHDEPVEAAFQRSLADWYQKWQSSKKVPMTHPLVPHQPGIPTVPTRSWFFYLSFLPEGVDGNKIRIGEPEDIPATIGVMWKNWLEGTKATIYTQSTSKGATIHTDDSSPDEPVTMIDLADVINYEQASKMQDPESKQKMEDLVAAIRDGQQLPPIYVRPSPNPSYQYQVIDGHHRYWAYKAAGVRQIPARIVRPENIRREKFYTPTNNVR